MHGAFAFPILAGSVTLPSMSFSCLLEEGQTIDVTADATSPVCAYAIDASAKIVFVECPF